MKKVLDSQSGHLYIIYMTGKHTRPPRIKQYLFCSACCAEYACTKPWARRECFNCGTALTEVDNLAVPVDKLNTYHVCLPCRHIFIADPPSRTICPLCLSDSTIKYRPGEL